MIGTKDLILNKVYIVSQVRTILIKYGQKVIVELDNKHNYFLQERYAKMFEGGEPIDIQPEKLRMIYKGTMDSQAINLEFAQEG